MKNMSRKNPLRDYIFSLIFIVVWLIPMAYAGLFHKNVPYAPNYLNYLYRVACLFTKRTSSWSNYYFQVQLKGNSEWIALPEEDYFKMQTFGYRTRFHRMMVHSRQQGRHGMLQRQSIAEFIKERYIYTSALFRHQF